MKSFFKGAGANILRGVAGAGVLSLYDKFQMIVFGKKFGGWSTYAEALYILPGSSRSYDPDAYWEWLVSLSYRVSANLRPGISLSGGTAPFDGAEDPLEVKARLSGLGTRGEQGQDDGTGDQG